MRVLVVNHDGLTREILERTLTPRGYDCVLVDNPAEAAALLGRQDFGVLLLDVFPERLEREYLRVVAGHPHMGVVVLRAFGGVFATEALRLGAGDLVAEPAELTELILRMGRAIERRALLASNIDDSR